MKDLDFDTGNPTRPGEYSLADNTYARLTRDLSKKNPATIDPALLHNVFAFYGDLRLPYATKKDAKDWQETLTALNKLHAETGTE